MTAHMDDTTIVSSQWLLEVSFKIITWNTKTLQNQTLPIIAVQTHQICTHVSVTFYSIVFKEIWFIDCHA